MAVAQVNTIKIYGLDSLAVIEIKYGKTTGTLALANEPKVYVGNQYQLVIVNNDKITFNNIITLKPETERVVIPFNGVIRYEIDFDILDTLITSSKEADKQYIKQCDEQIALLKEIKKAIEQ